MEVNVKGTTHPSFKSVIPEFATLWQSIEVGASLCVYYQGEKVVDLWGGYKDKDLTEEWLADTMVNVYSASKGITAFAIACLVDEGKLNYERPVAEYWPEFGAESKQDITVAQLLSHQAGLCGVETALCVQDLYDWQKMTNLLAAQKPLWNPGEKSGYHAVTWGYFPGELIRRITGLSISEYVKDKICSPLNADFYFGLPSSENGRYSQLIGPNHKRVVKNDPFEVKNHKRSSPSINASLFKLALMNPPISPFKDASSDAWRNAVIPASNGHASARGLARIYAAMSDGGKLGPTRICSAKALALANKVEVENTQDLVLGSVIRRSRGFILNTDHCYGPNPTAFGHAGAGGSMAFADPTANLSFAYVMNQMQDDKHEQRYERLVKVTYECAGNI